MATREPQPDDAADPEDAGRHAAAQEALADADGRGARSAAASSRPSSPATASCAPISIDPSVVDPDDIETLEDLVVAAVTEATRAAKELAAEKLGAVTGGLDLGARSRLRLGGWLVPVSVYEGPVQTLIDELGRLPGVGPKSAQRIAFYLLKVAPEDANRLAGAIVDAKDRVTWCRRCFNISEGELCAFCRDDAARHDACSASSRSRATSSRSSAPVSSAVATTCCRARSRRSRGSGPSSCASRSCSPHPATRASNEVILATNPNIEGEATAMYLARLLKPLGLRGDAHRERAARRRRPRVRRRGHARPRLRRPPRRRRLSRPSRRSVGSSSASARVMTLPTASVSMRKPSWPRSTG